MVDMQRKSTGYGRCARIEAAFERTAREVDRLIEDADTIKAEWRDVTNERLSESDEVRRRQLSERQNRLLAARDRATGRAISLLQYLRELLNDYELSVCGSRASDMESRIFGFQGRF